MRSSGLAVSVRGLAKEYVIRHNVIVPTTFAEAIARRVRHPLARVTREPFWALRDVSFDIGRGEVLALIGGNGAGKSTLLKILSRITEMTHGEVDLFGRVGSLLEVGTGFNQELTGRENIFLNGAILGMRRAEIREQFDEIVTFAGVERFLDTPVKHYSSGMYMRLAFAVAAHLRSEILIVDEVLAVGDQDFQRKCLGKMRDVATGGRTVILVSHNMAAISSLCSTAVVLRAGHLVYAGEVSGAVKQYMAREATEMVGDLRRRRDRSGSGEVRAVSVALRTARGDLSRAVVPGEPFEIVVTYEAQVALKDVALIIDLELPDGTRLASLNSDFHGDRFPISPAGGAFSCAVAGLPLRPDAYMLNVAFAGQHSIYDWVERAMSLEIAPADVYGTGRLPQSHQGPLLADYRWRVGEPVSIPG
jgi:lipopolysaccharide transport system ATP-binding protein